MALREEHAALEDAHSALKMQLSQQASTHELELSQLKTQLSLLQAQLTDSHLALWISEQLLCKGRTLVHRQHLAVTSVDLMRNATTALTRTRTYVKRAQPYPGKSLLD